PWPHCQFCSHLGCAGSSLRLAGRALVGARCCRRQRSSWSPVSRSSCRCCACHGGGFSRWRCGPFCGDVRSSPSAGRRCAGKEESRVVANLTVVEAILRDRHTFFAGIARGYQLSDKTRAMLISSIAFLALYGGVMGSTHSLWQAASSAIKLPVLFLAT